MVGFREGGSEFPELTCVTVVGRPESSDQR